MTQQLAKHKQTTPVTVEQALVQGDLSGLDPEQRVNYYLKVCSSLNLNPYTRPFDYLVLNGKLVLYARKDATDQLRDKRKVSITKLEREQIGDLLVVTATAQSADGRTDSSIGAVNAKGLAGEALANAMMKAETKSKRRVTLSLCGLGVLDESEVDSIPGVSFPELESTSFSDEKEEVPSTITRGDDPLWQRYLALCVEAQDIDLVVDMLALPVHRDSLIAVGKQLAAEIEAKKQEPVF